MASRFSIPIDNIWEFESKLEVPDGKDPDENAWLTITIRYSLNFVDGWNEKAGITVEKDNGYIALDHNKKSFPIRNWDGPSSMKFKRDFATGEQIWNDRFILITPRDYSGLDYESMAGTGWLVRPNVMCLFRLVPDNAKPHLRIDVVRLDPSINTHSFRSATTLYDDGDLYVPTFGHELSHALGLDHIVKMLGDPRCQVDQDKGICYGRNKWERETIAGGGTNMVLLFAKPWLDRIAQHTEIDKSKWTATLDTKTPPRKIPLGVTLIATPAQF